VKVGDRVRIVDLVTPIERVRLGLCGKIIGTSLQSNAHYCVRLDGSTCPLWFYPSEIRPLDVVERLAEIKP